MEALIGSTMCAVPFGFFFLFSFLLSNIKQINQYERGILFQMGKFKRIVEPGWTVILPVIQSLKKVDIRTKTIDLANQETMTKDNVSIRLGVVLYYRIADAGKAILNVEDSRYATSQLAETTMRSVVGEVELNQLLGHREMVASKIREIIESTVAEWGIEIKGVELKDVILPQDMKRTMAKQAEAQREKLAIITKSEGELEASQNLAKAARIMSAHPGALHLRTLSTINDVSSDQSNTIIFAMPIEVLRAIEGLGRKFAGASKQSVQKKK